MGKMPMPRRHLALMLLCARATLAKRSRLQFQGDAAITTPVKTDVAYQKCVSAHCGATYAIDEVRVACDACGGLLDVTYDWDRARPPESLRWFEQKWARRREPLCFS